MFLSGNLPNKRISISGIKSGLPFNLNDSHFISHIPYIALYFLIIAYVNTYR